MKRKQSVFDSKVEKRAFQAIKREWIDKLGRFDLYPGFQLTKLVDFVYDPSLKQREVGFLLKTSVDFTLTSRLNDKPILSVEFDGIGYGFNKDGLYIQQVQSNRDKYRKLKLDLKLKVCREAGYPLMVVSYRELNQISVDESLTILDGLIGAVLSQEWLDSGAGKKDFEATKKRAERMSGSQRQEWIEDSAIITEFQSKLQWNPIVRRYAQLLELVVNEKLVQSWPSCYLTKRFDSDEVAVRVAAETPRGNRSTTVRLRNANVNGIDVMEIAECIGRIRVFTKILRERGLTVPPPEPF